MESLIKISVSLAIVTIFAGNQHKVLKILKRAQIELVQDSKASR